MSNQTTDNDLRTRLHNAGTGEWVRRARFARTDETRDEMLRVSQLCIEALDEFDRLERERSEWAGVAATRNRNIALIAEERDRLRTALEAIAAFNPGDFRPLKDEVAIWRLATDALKRTVDVSVPTELK